MERTFGIDELAERAAAALVATGTAPPSARVTALPDKRVLRYYTTLGLLDRPVEVRARVAHYGRRHLLQVVAIKRLQAEGASLAEIQRRLAAASDADLEGIAGLPPDAASRPAAAEAARRRFWQAVPGTTAAAGPAPAAAGWPPPSPDPAAIRLAPGVTLVVDANRPLSAAEHEAVRAAAAGLVRHLSPLLKEVP